MKYFRLMHEFDNFFIKYLKLIHEIDHFRISTHACGVRIGPNWMQINKFGTTLR